VKKTLELEMLLFHLSPGLSHLPAYLKCASNSIAGRDIRLMFASLPSPRSCFTVFNKQGFTSIFFQLCELFCLAVSSATSYDACLIGGNFQQDSLTFQTRFMAWEEFYNFLWRGWNALSLNTASISKVSHNF